MLTSKVVHILRFGKGDLQMKKYRTLGTAVLLSTMVAISAPAPAAAVTLPEARASVIDLLTTRIAQLQVERDAAFAIYSYTSLSVAEREAARLDYQAICARQFKLNAQSRRIRFLPLRSLLALEAYLIPLVSPA